MMLTREQLTSRHDPPTEKVFIPGFGEGAYVIVRGFTVKERLLFEKSIQGANGKTVDGTKERLVVACCRDDSGNPLFKPDDVATLSQQPSAMIEPIVTAAMRLSGIGETDVDTLKKNSDETASGEPPTD